VILFFSAEGARAYAKAHGWTIFALVNGVGNATIKRTTSDGSGLH
jgi:hypothetical protein